MNAAQTFRGRTLGEVGEFALISAITADLDGRLAAAGLTHAQWKDWHDALVSSPALVTQLSEVGAPGCPGG